MSVDNRRDAETQRINEITERVIGICIDIHRKYGPGLLESAYEKCVCIGLRKAGLSFHTQVDAPVEYEGQKVTPGYRIDILVEGLVIIELKAVDKLLPIHEAQLLTYLKLTGLQVGLLINFNVPMLKAGIRRLVNNLPEPSASLRLCGVPDTPDIDKVKAAIPHREPFLFVDRVIERGEGRIVTERLVRADEPHFAGHYPGAPLMPGVLICEACFQTGAMLLADRSAGEAPALQADAGGAPTSRPVLTRILEAKFRGMVVPGDLMLIEVSQEEKMGDAYVMNGKVSVAGKNVLRVKFIVAMLTLQS